MAVALEHVEHCAVEMPVLLTRGVRSESLQVGLDRLDDRGEPRNDHGFAEHLRPAFPRLGGGRVDPRLVDQTLVEVTVGAFERANEGPLFRPGLPLLVLLLRLERIRLVVPNTGDRVDHARHRALPAFVSINYAIASVSATPPAPSVAMKASSNQRGCTSIARLARFRFRARPHRLRLKRTIAQFQIRLEAFGALLLEQPFLILVVGGMDQRAERAFQQ